MFTFSLLVSSFYTIIANIARFIGYPGMECLKKWQLSFDSKCNQAENKLYLIEVSVSFEFKQHIYSGPKTYAFIRNIQFKIGMIEANQPEQWSTETGKPTPEYGGILPAGISRRWCRMNELHCQVKPPPGYFLCFAVNFANVLVVCLRIRYKVLKRVWEMRWLIDLGVPDPFKS